MQNTSEVTSDDATPQSTRLLQELLTFRAKVLLLEEEVQNLRSENERLNKELAKNRQQMLEDEEASTKAFGLLGHELELSRAMAAHLKRELAKHVSNQ